MYYYHCYHHWCALATHFFKVRLIWEHPNTLWNVFSKCVIIVHKHFYWCKLLTHSEKNIHEVKLLVLCSYLIYGIYKCYNSFFKLRLIDLSLLKTENSKKSNAVILFLLWWREWLRVLHLFKFGVIDILLSLVYMR